MKKKMISLVLAAALVIGLLAWGFFGEMTGERETPELVYLGSSKQPVEEYEDVAKTEAAYLELLNTRHDREIGAGSTLWGIHKDDIQIV